MASSSQLLPALFLLATVSTSSTSQLSPCTSQTFTNNHRYAFGNELPALNSYLHWDYDEAQSTLSIGFVAARARPNSWVAWAINPTSTGMVGSQALVAFMDSRGAMTVKTYNVSSYGPLKESKVWYEVKESSAEFSDGVIRLYAIVVMPEKGRKTVNHVWQVGPSVTDGVPDGHEFQTGNLHSKGSLHLVRGGDSRTKERKLLRQQSTKERSIHGLLNVFSWGIMFPIGLIIARYWRTFPSADPAWFYSHVFCQVSAYATGAAGWGMGLKLGRESKGVKNSDHRNIGLALMTLATLQIFALLFRRKKENMYRFCWICHRGFGYAVVILGIVNVFKGFGILKPQPKWRNAYVVVLAVLGGIALLLEAVTWIIYLQKKSSYGNYNEFKTSTANSPDHFISKP